MDNSITKNIQHGSEPVGVPDEEAMELISRFARKTPEKESIYTFSVILCDNETDRDFERFDIPALQKLCEIFPGVTGIFDHSMKSGDQTARVYKTQVLTDDTKITSSGEKYTYLKAWCYMLRSQKNEQLIEEINSGIKKEVSISCSVKEKECSICAKDIRSNECSHTPGRVYNKKLCHAVLKNPYDAYEWSFVAVPAQRNAGVSKSMKKKESPAKTFSQQEPEEILKAAAASEDSVTLSHLQVKAFNEYIKSLLSDANTGKQQRASAEKEIISLAAFTLPEADTSMLASILGKLTGDEVLMLHKAFSDRAGRLSVYSQALSTEKQKAFFDNSQFKI